MSDVENRLNVLEQDRIAKDNQPALKGNRTIIAGWITALAPIAALLGIDYSPEEVIKFIQEFKQLLIVGFAGLGTAIHNFRNKA